MYKTCNNKISLHLIRVIYNILQHLIYIFIKTITTVLLQRLLVKWNKKFKKEIAKKVFQTDFTLGLWNLFFLCLYFFIGFLSLSSRSLEMVWTIVSSAGYWKIPFLCGVKKNRCKIRRFRLFTLIHFNSIQSCTYIFLFIFNIEWQMR